jgi:hypothetical protein
MIRSLLSSVLPRWVAVAALVSLSSCAIVPPTGSPTPQYLLRDALTSPLGELEGRAEKGDARAQFGLSILYKYGLRGKQFDPVTASQWRGKALNARSTMPITQYIPGINGKPGRTAIINMPKSDLSAAEVEAADTCAARLGAGFPDLQATASCGGPGSFVQLSQLWASAKFGI